MEIRTDNLYYFMKTVESFHNKWYRWGGDDPSGVDCSGLVIEGLKAVGLIKPHDDMTADQLWHRFHANEVIRPSRGCLAFWFNEGGRATHVAVCVSFDKCLTADGGGSRVKTVEDAERHNAFIKYRPIGHRLSKPRYIYLF